MQIGAQTRGAAASGSPASCGTAWQLDAPSGAGWTEPRSLVRVGLGLSTGPGNPEGCRSPASDASRAAPGAHPAQGERLVLSDPPPIPASQAPARIPHTLPSGPAGACSTRVSTCPVRKNSARSLPAFPSRLTIARSARHPNPHFSSELLSASPPRPLCSPEHTRGPRCSSRGPVRTRPSLQAQPRAEGGVGERLNPVPRGSPRCWRLGSRGRGGARSLLRAGGGGCRRRPGGGSGEEGVGSRGGFRGAWGTRDCSSDPRDPAPGRLLRAGLFQTPGRGIPAPTLLFGCPRETLQAPRMAPRHPGLRFPAEAKLT